MWKYFTPKLFEVIGGTKPSFIMKQLYVRRVSLQSHGQSKWVCLGLEIKQNH